MEKSIRINEEIYTYKRSKLYGWLFMVVQKQSHGIRMYGMPWLGGSRDGIGYLMMISLWWLQSCNHSRRAL
jgi:hypothetical protein